MFSIRRVSPTSVGSLARAFSEDLDPFFEMLGGLPTLPDLPVVPRASLRFKVVEHPDRFEVSIEAPGARKEDMKLRVKEQSLIVEYAPQDAGERKEAAANETGRVVLDEHTQIRARRELRFSTDLADTGHCASMENGVLAVRLMKKAPVPPQAASRELAIS
jgi:HSP20 family molecular chaperone IbpA